MSKRSGPSPRLPSIGSFDHLEQLTPAASLSARSSRRGWVSLLWSSNRRTSAGRHLHSDQVDTPDDTKDDPIYEKRQDGTTHEDDGLPKTSYRRIDSLVSKLDQRRKNMAISRKGAFVVFILLLLGLYESNSSSSLLNSNNLNGIKSDGRKKRGNQIVDVKGRDPFDVLQEIEGFSSLIPPTSHRFLASINARRHKLLRRPGSAPLEPPATSFHETQHHIWRSSPGSNEGEARESKAEGDTTAIVLNWKRAENVVVIVASLCQYSFFQTVLVWNNNPEIFLTREVSPLPAVPPCLSHLAWNLLTLSPLHQRRTRCSMPPDVPPQN